MSTHFYLKLILLSTVVHYPILDGWSDFRLLLCWLRKGGSLDNVTCLLWPNLFLDPTSCLSSLILVFPQALWHPWVRPMTQYPYPGLSFVQAQFKNKWWRLLKKKKTCILQNYYYPIKILKGIKKETSIWKPRHA